MALPTVGRSTRVPAESYPGDCATVPIRPPSEGLRPGRGAGGMTPYQAILATPLGPIGVQMDAAGRLVTLDYLPSRTRLIEPVTPAAGRVVRALEAYFTAPRHRFDVPLAPLGTAHQQRVWAALREIPSGQSRTYGELADVVGSASRAVGQACRRNPIPIIIPCHRVVARGGIGGYSGATAGPELAIKRWLLAHEGGLPGG